MQNCWHIVNVRLCEQLLFIVLERCIFDQINNTEIVTVRTAASDVLHSSKH